MEKVYVVVGTYEDEIHIIGAYKDLTVAKEKFIDYLVGVCSFRSRRAENIADSMFESEPRQYDGDDGKWILHHIPVFQ